MKPTLRLPCRAASILLLVTTLYLPAQAVTPVPALDSGFTRPPDSAKPWVYWFWLNGNITREGITADLEAMHRTGIGGVLIMEVDQGAPLGPASFAGPQWRDLFKHVCSEASRLGIKVNMNNDAGWCGSGGPWVTPELSMQQVVWTETRVLGPVHYDAVLPKPLATAGYYRDIALLAFPTPATNWRINNIRGKSALVRQEIPLRAHFPAAPADSSISRTQLANLSASLDSNGHLSWDVPAGQWTIMRIGHTGTGANNSPAPISGRGLECDKLSKTAVEAHFNGLMGKLIADNKALAGESATLVATHIDSWEVGSQNWSPRFREDFQRLRGYDPIPFLPVLSGRVVENTEISERFLWDFRQTISELTIENYAGHFRELAHRNGLRLSIEAYDGCCDDMTYAGQADEPMGEFWSYNPYSGADWCTEMASAAHVYGRPILGAEAFTATDAEKWLAHPGSIKAMGDWAFCEGINRFVFHRYALQPWTDRRPGMSMGPWGLHYERTQTWWEQTSAWHEYLSRCQYLLQQGRFVADTCFLAPENGPQRFHSPVKAGRDRPGYNFDACTPEALLTRMKVADGRLVLPDGMNYRLLVLPQVPTMTPALLSRIKDLVAQGATIVGAPPLKSPSLTDYPRCDEQVKQLARELWGDGPAPSQLTERRYGKGRILWGGDFRPRESLTTETPSILATAKWIWRAEGTPALSAPPGKRLFRRTLTIDSSSPIASARLSMTADNSFECWLNGQRIGAGDNFARSYEMNIAPHLKPGANLLAVAAVNATDNPNPAGLIASLTIKYRDGHTQTCITDSQWESATTAPASWTSSATAAGDWSAAMELGPSGMAPWGDIDEPQTSNDPTADVRLICRILAQTGLPPDFSYQATAADGALRYIHRTIGNTELYFVANGGNQRVDALCRFRITGKRPELWSPDTGRIERAVAYDSSDNCTRLPISLAPSGSVFVIFRQPADPDPNRIIRIARNGETVMDTAWRSVQPQDDTAITNTFTMAAWVRPAADTDLPPEANAGHDAFAARRNDALFPPPGHEVYSGERQAGSGVAVGRNGVGIFEHAADYFAPLLVSATPLTQWTHVAVVYRDAQPSLYLNGKLVRQGLKSHFTVHPGVGVRHTRQVAPFQGDLGEWQVFDHALSQGEIAKLTTSTPRPVSRTHASSLSLVHRSDGALEALARESGTYVLTMASGQTREIQVNSPPAPIELTGAWDLDFPTGQGTPEHLTLDKLISWSQHTNPAVQHFSGTATYHKRFTLSSDIAAQDRQLTLDLGNVQVIAEVKLNGKPLGILWKSPYQVDITTAARAGENDLEIKVTNLWINRMIGDEQLPDDSERNPGGGTLKRWPQWLQENKPSPTGRFTFTSWRLWKKSDPLAESGLIGPVKLHVADRIEIK